MAQGLRRVFREDEVRVEWAQRGRTVVFRISVEQDDRPRPRPGLSLRSDQWSVEVIKGFDLSATHPDLLALSVMLVVHPFVGRRIVFPSAVSRDLATAARYALAPVDHTLRGRARGRHPGLAYSGGVDSTAALTVMPRDTVAVFMQRVAPANLAGATTLRRLMHRGYRADAALHAINTLRARGRTAIALRASYQFVREPVGFPVDISTAVPAILNADALGLGSMAWGTVLESAYRVGHHHFEDYTQRWHYQYWGRVMAAAGLPMNQVAAGMSEVATTAIAIRSPWAPVVESCVRGRVGRPCLSCWKCFRKTLVERAVAGQDLGDIELDALFAIPEAITNLRKVPIKHENVLAFATSRYTGNHQLMILLRARTRGDWIPVDWMTRWYSPSIALLPGDLRNATMAAIKTQLDPMDVTDEEHVREWNLDAELNSEQYRQAAQQLATRL